MKSLRVSLGILQLRRAVFCQVPSLFVAGATCLAQTNDQAVPSPEPAKPGLNFEMSIDELERQSVGTASRYVQPVAQAPSSISVLTTDDFKKFGYRTLADALQSVPGFFVSSDRVRSFLGVRGFNASDYNSRILLLVDGHRQNNNLSDGAYIGTDFILDVDLIEKVEIIRGPGSVLYGDNAFFGVINVITRRGKKLDGAEISGEAGSFDTYQGRATYGSGFKNGLEFLVSGTIHESEGADELTYKVDHQKIDVREVDGDWTKSAFGVITFDPTRGQGEGKPDFRLEGAYSTREKVDPTAPFGTEFGNAATRTTDRRSYADLSYEHSFPDVLDVLAKIYYDRYDLDSDLAYALPFLNTEKQIGEWWGAEAQLRRKLFDRHQLVFGAEYRDDFRQQRENYSDNVLNIRQDQTRESYGVYLQAEAVILTNLLLNAGARYDYYTTFGDTVNPRVALIYQPWQPAVFKAIYGTAFRAPNFFETLNYENLHGSGATGLEPETITTYELVYEQSYGRHWSSVLSGYFNQIKDLIAIRNNAYENVEGADAKGVEVELRGKWDWGLNARLSYSYTQTEDRETGERLIYVPEHLAKLNLSVPVFTEKLFAGLEFLFMSQRATLQGPDAPEFGLVNFTLFSPNLIKGLDLTASVYNLFDNHYQDPATPFHQQNLIPRDERSFRFKVTYRF